MVMSSTEKSRETVLRKQAARRGLRLERSRRRDEYAGGYGLYRFVYAYDGRLASSPNAYTEDYTLTLEEAELWLQG